MEGIKVRVETKEAFKELMGKLIERNIVNGNVKAWYLKYEEALVKDDLFPMDIPFDPNELLKLLDHPLARKKYAGKISSELQPRIVEILTRT